MDCLTEFLLIDLKFSRPFTRFENFRLNLYMFYESQKNQSEGDQRDLQSEGLFLM